MGKDSVRNKERMIGASKKLGQFVSGRVRIRNPRPNITKHPSSLVSASSRYLCFQPGSKRRQRPSQHVHVLAQHKKMHRDF